MTWLSIFRLSAESKGERMIYSIDTDQLMKEYSKLGTEQCCDNTNYLIFSGKIINTQSRPNVLSIYTVFNACGLLKGVQINTDLNSIQAREEFKSWLLTRPKEILFLVEIILNDLTTDEDTLFITTPSETAMIKIMADVIGDIFSYKMKRYPDEAEINLNDCLAKLNYYFSASDELMIDSTKDLSTKAKLLSSKSKKYLRKFLKNKGLETDGLSKTEMIELILEGR